MSQSVPTKDNLQSALTFIQNKLQSRRPSIGLILGSGLGYLADSVEDQISINYSDIPCFPVTTVDGHKGQLVSGKLGSKEVIICKGRIHLYEGYSPAEVVFPVRLMGLLGVETLLVTNASGGIAEELDAGTLMLIRDHINLTGMNPLYGPNEESWGPRFPDMTYAYPQDLRRMAKDVAANLGMTIYEGVYAGVLGPSYETPAEIRMLSTLGADAVGMSTVHEVVAAVHMGLRILGISFVSNRAAGLASGALSHEDVKQVAQTHAMTTADLIRAIVQQLG